MVDSKSRVADLLKQLREAARMQDPSARAVVELVKLLGDDAKDSLVMSADNDMVRAQGAARMLRKLHTDLTTTPPKITQE